MDNITYDGHDSKGHWFTFKEEKRFDDLDYGVAKDKADRWALFKLNKAPRMTDAEMFQWIIDNKATISYSSPIKWTREDGSVFYCDFILSSGGTQWGAYSTLREAIMQANALLKGRDGK